MKVQNVLKSGTDQSNLHRHRPVVLIERWMFHSVKLSYLGTLTPATQKQHGTTMEAQGHVVAYPTMLKPVTIINRYNTYGKVPSHLTSASRVGMYYALKPT